MSERALWDTQDLDPSMLPFQSTQLSKLAMGWNWMKSKQREEPEETFEKKDCSTKWKIENRIPRFTHASFDFLQLRWNKLASSQPSQATSRLWMHGELQGTWWHLCMLQSVHSPRESLALDWEKELGQQVESNSESIRKGKREKSKMTSCQSVGF